MNDAEKNSKPPQKYADSSISDKAFKRVILWFFIYCSLFLVGVFIAVGADNSNYFN